MDAVDDRRDEVVDEELVTAVVAVRGGGVARGQSGGVVYRRMPAGERRSQVGGDVTQSGIVGIHRGRAFEVFGDVVDPRLVLPDADLGELLEAALGTEEAKARLADVRGVPDASELVDAHRAPVGHLEQC